MEIIKKNLFCYSIVFLSYYFPSYLQWTSSFHPYSIALAAINRFSARHDRCFPLSSLDGVMVMMLVVTFPSTEMLSLSAFSLEVPFHHVMIAGGLEPVALQTSSTVFKADKGCLSPSIMTSNGRTVKGRDKIVWNGRC